MNDRARLDAMGALRAQAAHPDAARNIARICFEIAGEGEAAA